MTLLECVSMAAKTPGYATRNMASYVLTAYISAVLNVIIGRLFSCSVDVTHIVFI